MVINRLGKFGGKYRDSGLKNFSIEDWLASDCGIYQGSCNDILNHDSVGSVDLVLTSPPYNVGKAYENCCGLQKYLQVQEKVVEGCVRLLSETGTICWQVGVTKNGHEYLPLEYPFYDIFKGLGMTLRNRIVWQYNHGLHSHNRFDGRHEVIQIWVKNPEKAKFNLDAVRVPQKYKNKRKDGKLTCNPLGKNPGDVWDNIPNVKANHCERLRLWDAHNKKWVYHPCQFPVGLVERCVLAYTDEGDRVFDPYCGVGSTAVGAITHGRKFWGCEKYAKYAMGAEERVNGLLSGSVTFRSHLQPIQVVPAGA